MVINIGDIDITFCKDVSCGSAYANYGKVIGLNTEGGVSTPNAIYPYETDALALETNPYIFNVNNTGKLKVYFNAYLEEDEDFVPTGNYADYTSITALYSNYVKVGVSNCDNGVINRSDVDIYTFGELVDGKIIDNIEMNSEEENTYCVWTWLDSTTPNEVQETYFVANLNFTAEYVPSRPWYTECASNSSNLNCKIVANTNCITNSTVTSCTPQDDNTANIHFNQISSDTNGLGLYYTDTEGETEDYDRNGTADRVYYYRGAVTNNNVRFGGYCWRIIRTNEDGSVRMRYNGEWNGSTCPSTGTSVNTANSKFYTSYSNLEDNEYVQSGGASSTIKTAVETWYTNNIENSSLNTSNALTGKIANVVYCADKSNETIMNNSTRWYGAANRLINIHDLNSIWTTSGVLSNAQPIFKCNDSENKHTAANDTWNGNKKLSKPVGLITADEVAYAGGAWLNENDTYYLYTSSHYWSISTGGVYGTGANVLCMKSDGRLDSNHTLNVLPVLPVISLKVDTLVSSGNGSYTQPYIVGPN